MPAGRPAMWADPIAFDKKVDEYFEYCKGHEVQTKKVADSGNIEEDFIIVSEYPTWTGLAMYLGFESRQSLQDYKEKPEFTYSIKKALCRIEANYEQSLFSRNPAGAIFALKNFGWKDKQEVEQTTIVKTLDFKDAQ